MEWKRDVFISKGEIIFKEADWGKIGGKVGGKVVGVKTRDLDN